MKLMKDKNHTKYTGSKTAIAFYVLAVIFLAYGAYMIYTVYNYLIDYYASYSMGMWDDVANTMQYFMSNSSAYFVYAVLCYGVGKILQSINKLSNHFSLKDVTVEEMAIEEDDVVENTTIEFNSKEKTA